MRVRRFSSTSSTVFAKTTHKDTGLCFGSLNLVSLDTCASDHKTLPNGDSNCKGRF